MWKILVADDEFVNREIISEMLRGKAECAGVANGREAIEAFNFANKSGKPYDAILLDIAMPVMDGMEVLKRIRENEKIAGIPPGKGMPIIMITLHKSPVVESFNSGCDDYIVKPIKAGDLLNKIKNMLAKIR